MTDVDGAASEARRAFEAREWAAVLAAVDAQALEGGASASSLRLKGWALYRLRRHTEGLAAFNAAEDLEPGTPDAALGRGRCHRMLGHIDDAAGEFALAHRLAPGDPHPLCERGAVLILDERWDEALADYRAAEALNPGHPGLASYFAELYLYAGRPLEALDAAQRGLEREPRSVMHRVNRAHALLFAGRLDDAMGAYGELHDMVDAGEHTTGGAIALNDLGLMRAAGLTCAGFDAVEAMLNAPPPP